MNQLNNYLYNGKKISHKIVADYIKDLCRKNNYDDIQKVIYVFGIDHKTLIDNETILNIIIECDRNGYGIKFIKRNFTPSQFKHMFNYIGDYTIFHSAAHNCNNIKILKFLLRFVKDKEIVKRNNIFDSTPKYIAANKGGVKWCKILDRFYYTFDRNVHLK